MKQVLAILLLAVSCAAQPQAVIGSLRHGENLQISVIFTEPVDVPSLLALDSYSLSPGTLFSSVLIATNRGALLQAAGVPIGIEPSFSVSGARAPDGAPITPTNVFLSALPPQWVGIGANELGLPFSATAVGPDGFDVISGGYQQTGDYDEATFVAERVSADFDRWVRVDFVQPASSSARAGLMVRETLDAGKPRPNDPLSYEQAFSRYLEIAINPPETASGGSGGNQHEILQRAYAGGIGRPSNPITRSLPIETNAPPFFPDVWLRVRRSGDTFEMFRGTNRVDWISIGTVTFPQPMPESLYVGPCLSPQTGALPQGYRRSYLAKFREYGGLDRERLELKIEGLEPGEFELSWTGQGILEHAGEATGEWVTAPDQSNPQVVDLQETKRFFRLRAGDL